MGWGTITGNSVSNPLAELHDRFKDRNLNSGDEDSVGGEVNYGSFFAGEEVGVFAGIEYFVPRFNGLRIMFELDPTNYNAEAYKPVARTLILILVLSILLIKIYFLNWVI